ncbi:TPA: hypothetical protein ACPVXB_001029 [Vibrio parahaemolyticus]
MTIKNKTPFKNTYLPVKSNDKVIAKEFLVQKDDGSLVPVGEGSSGGSGVDLSKPLKVGNTTYNLVNFTNTEHGYSKNVNSAVIHTNIDWINGTNIPDKEFTLRISGNSFLLSGSYHDDPDGYASPVELLGSYGLRNDSNSVNAKHVVTSDAVASSTSVYFLRNSQNKLCISLSCSNSLASFQVDFLGGSLTEEELTGWDVVSHQKYINSSPSASEYGYTYVVSSQPASAIQSAPSLSSLKGQYNHQISIPDGLTKSVLGLVQVTTDATGVARTFNGVVCFDYSWKDHNTKHSEHVTGSMYVSIHSYKGSYSASYQVLSGDLSMIKLVEFNRNGYLYVGVSVDNTYLGCEWENLRVIPFNNSSSSYSTYQYFKANSLGSQEGTINNTEIHNSIKPANTIATDLESSSTPLAPDFKVKKDDGSVISLLGKINELEARLEALTV